MKTTSVAVLFLLALCYATSARGQTPAWTRQLGTSSFDENSGVSSDGLGSVYISGWTDGSFDGTNAGERDAFVAKYNASGTLEWTRQLGTSDLDGSLGVSADGVSSVYMSGTTWGNLEGTNVGRSDAFLSKYDTNGNLQWTRQFGTGAFDYSSGVSSDGLGSVYVTGVTEGRLDGTRAGVRDVFVAKYDASGTLQWTRQFGTSGNDASGGVSADGLGNVYISGWTEGSLEGPSSGRTDAFLSKYDASGTLAWTRQLGTSSGDGSSGVSADGLGNVYISGTTDGSLGGANAGGIDVFVAKYDARGTLQWTRQFGTGDFDDSSGVSSDGLGSVYVSGWTDGSLEGISAGERDAFVAKYNARGTLEWTRQLGTSGNDASGGVSADGLGSVYISGTTDGSLKGQNAGDFDAFVAKFRIDFPTDLDFDGDSDGDDVDSLVGEIVAGTNNSAFDLTADAIVDNADLSQWLSDAATANGFTAPYLLGDANLDGSVNASDLNILGQNWLASPDTWQFGDFNADGIVNAGDLNELAQNWQQAIPSAASPESVPEPSAIFLVLLGIMATSLLKHRRRSDRFSHVSNV